MATQTELSSQPKSARTNAEQQIPQNANPEIISTTVKRVSRQSVEPLTQEQRRELIAVAAYYLAEGRNFQPGHEEEDWLAAEAQIGRL
jgi:hypothetical protein